MQIKGIILLTALILGGAPLNASAKGQQPTAERVSHPDGRTLLLASAAEDPFRKGLQASKKGDWEAALKAFSEAIKLNPAYAKAYYERGGVLLKQKSYDQALADFSKVIELKDPELLVGAYNNRGLIYNEYNQKYDQAIDDFTRAIQISPSNALAYFNRALASDRAGKPDPAIADYSKAIALDGKYVDAYNNRGIVYLETKQLEKALADFSKAVALQPDYALGYYNQGMALAYLKKYDESLENYTKAISLNPAYAQAYHNRGYLYNDIRKDYPKALADFNKALELNPEYLNAYYNRGLTYFNDNKNDKALADFSEVIKRNPKDADAYYYRGECNFKLSQWEPAIADFQQVTQLIPNDAWSYFWLAKLYSINRDFDKSLAALATAIKYNPDFKRQAQTEASLVFLRNLPEFKKLVQ